MFGVNSLYYQKPNKILALDKFNRSDTTEGIGIADTGQTWITQSGSWGIQNNSAIGLSNGRTYLETDYDGMLFTVTVNGNFSGQRLLLRFEDTLNEIYIQRINNSGYVLIIRENGTLIEVGSISIIPTSGDVISTIIDNNSIVIRINGIRRLQYNTTFLSGNNKFGFYRQSSNNTIYDNLSVVAI